MVPALTWEQPTAYSVMTAPVCFYGDPDYGYRH